MKKALIVLLMIISPVSVLVLLIVFGPKKLLDGFDKIASKIWKN